MNREGNYENPEYQRKVYKDYKRRKVSQIIVDDIPNGSHILIVFWHGLGDLLMFLPIYNYLKIAFKNHHFDLCVQPGVGQKEFYPDALEMDESVFVKNHHTAFVISFPMIEGANSMTKAEYCCVSELGIEKIYLGVYTPLGVHNKLIGVHFHGTCLPDSTNPDEELCKTIWDDLIGLGYIPIDVHFEHSFHNPKNKRFPWQLRSCRDIKPNIVVLQSIIQRCHIFIGVASGPFVLACGIMPKRVIYLEKNHPVDCYLRGFDNIIKLSEYSRDKLENVIDKINKENIL